MKKRIAKKQAKRFLQGKYPCGIRIETGCYSGGRGLYEAYAVLPARVAQWAERLTHAGASGRFDTPIFLGAVDWYTGEWVDGGGWGTEWEQVIRSRRGKGGKE